MYRSTISGDRWELIGEAPKNWKKDGAWKKARFRDTLTGDIIKYDDIIKGKGLTLEDYINKEGGAGAYDNSLKTWQNKRDLGKIKNMFQGKEQSLGYVLNKKVVERMGKVPPKGWKNISGLGAFQVAHTKGVGNNFWEVEVAFRDSNENLNNLNRRLLKELKTGDCRLYLSK